MSTVLKPVSFNIKKDADLLNHIKAIDVSFATYVKDLIKKDMAEMLKEQTEDKSEVSELIAVLKQMINNNNNMMMQMPMMMQMMGQMGQMQMGQQVKPPEPVEEKKPEVSEVQKQAVNNIMARFKK